MAQTRVLLGRVGGGSGVPQVAPEVVLTAAGAGSNWNVIRTFNINLDMDDPTAAVYSLRNTDFNMIYYAIQLNLANVAPGKSKTLLLDIRGLRTARLVSPSSPDNSWRDYDRYSRTFSKAMGIWEDGVRNTEWRGRDNIWRMVSDAHGNAALHNIAYQAHYNWRQMMKYVGPTPTDMQAVTYPNNWAWRGDTRPWSTYSYSHIQGFASGTPPGVINRWRDVPSGGSAYVQYWTGPYPGSPTGSWVNGQWRVGGAILRRLSLYSGSTWYQEWVERGRKDGGTLHDNPYPMARTYRLKFEYYGDVQGGRLLTVDSFHPIGYADT